jgi:hypothetical protein
MRHLLLLSLFVMCGCARIHINCPADSIEHVMVGGSNVGTVALSALITAGTTAGLLLAPEPTVTRPPMATIDYTYVPIFGMDYVECGQGPLPMH